MDHPGGHPGAGYGSRLPGYNGRSLDALNDYLGDLASYRYAASREATGLVPDDPDIRFDAVGVTGVFWNEAEAPATKRHQD